MLKFNDGSHSLNSKALHLVKYDQFVINTKKAEWKKGWISGEYVLSNEKNDNEN